MSSTSAAASNAAPAKEVRYVTEVPSSLKQLARLVVRGFYSLEDALIIDMLVRNPCMKEDDMASCCGSRRSSSERASPRCAPTNSSRSG
ncbi:GL16278 [Drosophila persimilis]|uniref:GL16278 n=1 Tax=Drosophila persimilis TaxID=7234 RepID=B4HAH8_DROPE|nr:GL16278 [Drosophila persimilis]